MPNLILFKKKSTVGFTLIELVMVIAIIGILAGIALPKFFDLQTSAKIAATKAGVGAIRSVIAIQYAYNAAIHSQAPIQLPLPPPVTPPGIQVKPSYFADGQYPKNALTGLSDVARINGTVSGTTTSATEGFWFVGSSNSPDYGRVGAYSDGVIDTSDF